MQMMDKKFRRRAFIYCGYTTTLCDVIKRYARLIKKRRLTACIKNINPIFKYQNRRKLQNGLQKISHSKKLTLKNEQIEKTGLILCPQ